MNRKAKLVYLDPRYHGHRRQGRRVVPDPAGADMAFILAMIHVIIAEERYDKAFVATRCTASSSSRACEAVHARVGGRRDRDPGPRHRPHRPRVRRRRAPRAVLRRPALVLVHQRLPDAARAGDPQRHRRELDRAGRRGPEQQDRARRVPVLPWDEPTAERVDQIDTAFPLAAKGDGVFLQARENILAGKPYP